MHLFRGRLNPLTPALYTLILYTELDNNREKKYSSLPVEDWAADHFRFAVPLDCERNEAGDAAVEDGHLVIEPVGLRGHLDGRRFRVDGANGRSGRSLECETLAVYAYDLNKT